MSMVVRSTPAGLQIWRTNDAGEVVAILEVAEGTRVVIDANADLQVRVGSTKGWSERLVGDVKELLPPA